MSACHWPGCQLTSKTLGYCAPHAFHMSPELSSQLCVAHPQGEDSAAYRRALGEVQLWINSHRTIERTRDVLPPGGIQLAAGDTSHPDGRRYHLYWCLDNREISRVAQRRGGVWTVHYQHRYSSQAFPSFDDAQRDLLLGV